MESAQISGSKNSQEKWESSGNKATVRQYITHLQDIQVYHYLEHCSESWPVQFKDGEDRGVVEKDN